jgi:STE24 endopeptidase
VRTVAAAVAVVGAVLFVTLAVVLVPWHPVPGGGPSTLPAPDTVLSREQLARAEAYAGPARWLGWSSLVVSLVVVCWLGFTEAALRLVGRLRGWWWVRVVLGVALVSLVGRLATLPFAIVAYRRRVSYGLSTQAWPDWLRDVAVSWAVNVVASSLVLLVIVGTARRWRTWWPAIAGGIAATLVMLGSFVYPCWSSRCSAPSPRCPTGPCARGCSSWPRPRACTSTTCWRRTPRAGPRRSTPTCRGSAARGGSCSTTTSSATSRRTQVLSVVAHELSHARHDDVLTGSLLGAAGSVLGIGLLGLVIERRRRRARDPEMQRTAGDPAVVPLVLALVARWRGCWPVRSRTGISRRIETRADVDALLATRDPQAFIEVQRQLASRSLADLTGPAWTQFWFGSHPTTRERIAIAGWLSDQ